jgi:UDP-N-acetylglucosamine 4,6-dehydratase
MRILVTGYAGTIGGEFTRRYLEMGHEVTGVDNNEWATVVYPEHRNLTKILGDFSNISGEFDLIIHCAAYKHIELIEHNRRSAFENNVVKTEFLYDYIKAPILFISTDKAVEPSSYYGVTKQMGEETTKKYGGVIARLGNVMNSTGSVIPKWEQAVAENKPIPITDFSMTRYMLPVEDMVDKIIRLQEYAKKGQVIIPEMGRPIKLKTLFKRFLETKGLEDYPVKIIGFREAEKKYEQLKWADERVVYKDKYGEIVQ